jgi:TadE-like protein
MSAPVRRAGARAGVVALEFALIGPVFLTFVLGILQVGFLLFAQVALDYALRETSRQVQVGNAQTIMTPDAFHTILFCPVMSALIDCSSVIISLVPVTDYHTEATQTPPFVNGQINQAALGYTPGGSGSLMQLRAFYTPPLSNWPLNVTALVSTVAFRNEF